MAGRIVNGYFVIDEKINQAAEKKPYGL